MKEIPLSQGYVTLVDDADYPELSSHTWHSHITILKNGTKYVRAVRNKNKTTCKMSREIMGVTDPKDIVDHIDRNPLNNQRLNLRVVTQSQNVLNKENYKGTPYKGVCFDKSRGKFMSYINVNGARKYLGRFSDEISAAIEYNKMAIMLHGDFALLNKIPS